MLDTENKMFRASIVSETLRYFQMLKRVWREIIEVITQHISLLGRQRKKERVIFAQYGYCQLTMITRIDNGKTILFRSMSEFSFSTQNQVYSRNAYCD